MQKRIKYRFLPLFLLVFVLTPFVRSQSVHHLNAWGGLGYSSLLHGMDYTKVPGGFGYELGFGYQLDFGRFMLNAGLEFQHLNSKTKLIGYSTPYQFQYIGTAIPGSDSHYINYGYEFLQYEEKHSVGYLNIPLLFGVRFDRYYALLGAKVGVNMFGNYKVEDARVRISADDPMLIIPMENIGHGTGEQVFQSTGKMDLGLSIAPTAEFGVYLNDWLPRSMTNLSNRGRTPLVYRLGLFVDYGLLNINKSSSDKPVVNAPLNNDPSNISLNPLSESYLAQDKSFRGLAAGLKLTVQFQLNKARKPKPIPPTPTFYVRVFDEQTLEPLDADVKLDMTVGRKEEVFRQRTDADGVVSHAELKAGRYLLTSTSEGYNTYRKNIRHSNEDTLLVPMKLTPVFYAYVYDLDTKVPLKAEVSIMAANAPANSKPIFKAQTDAATGIVEGDIRTGRYQVSATSEGYIYHQELVNYMKTDTLRIGLQPIKKDVVVVLHNLFFALNEAQILPESEAGLEDLAQFLHQNEKVSIKIIGHTDSTGSVDYNMRLSENRAKAVYDDLVSRGISASRLSYEGRGSREPVATNDTDEGRAQNRRVEFVIQ